jgi:hypothetical protein
MSSQEQEAGSGSGAFFTLDPNMDPGYVLPSKKTLKFGVNWLRIFAVPVPKIL